jgi:transposase
VGAAIADTTEARKPARRPLPEHLPRENSFIPRPAPARPAGGTLRRIGDDITKRLDYVQGRFKVTRHVRAKLSCWACDTVAAAPVPDHAITGGRPTG